MLLNVCLLRIGLLCRLNPALLIGVALPGIRLVLMAMRALVLTPRWYVVELVLCRLSALLPPLPVIYGRRLSVYGVGLLLLPWVSIAMATFPLPSLHAVAMAMLNGQLLRPGKCSDRAMSPLASDLSPYTHRHVQLRPVPPCGLGRHLPIGV